MQQNKIKPPFLIESFQNFPLQKRKMFQTKEGVQNWVNYLLRSSYITDVKVVRALEKDSISSSFSCYKRWIFVLFTFR